MPHEDVVFEVDGSGFRSWDGVGGVRGSGVGLLGVGVGLGSELCLAVGEGALVGVLAGTWLSGLVRSTCRQWS